MSSRRTLLTASATFCFALLAVSRCAVGQNAAQQPSALPTSPTKAAATQQSVATSDAARKAEILASDCWRRAIFERNEWLRAQSVFPPDEVARIKADFAARVDQMSAKELEFVLTDLQAKFRILETPEAREVRAWFGHYFSILADRRREELLKELPDVATMNSTQLQQTIDRLAARRDSRARQQTQKQALRNSATNPWNQGTAQSNRPTPRSTYRSPYRPASRERPFENVQVGPNRRRMIDPDGRIWLNF